MMLLEEMASIFLTPYLLLFVVPKRVDDILQFIVDFTVDVEGVGHVCSKLSNTSHVPGSFSLFDFKNHGNRKYGSPFSSRCDQRSSQGKMEKSFLSFQIAYPSWEPNADGKQFLTTIKIFRDQKMQGRGTSTAHTPSGMQHQNPNFRGLGDRNSFSREMPFNNLGNFHQFDSMWLIDCEQKNFPYILDWYYTSQNHDREDSLRDNIPSRHHDYDEENPEDLWIPSGFTRNDATYDDKWDDNLFDDRARSHLEASTSAPLFQESVLQHHESDEAGQPARSHWWARRTPQGPDQQTSFLEPPNFYNEAPHNLYDNLSDKSVEEPQLDFRNSRGLSRTFYMDDLDGGDFSLPFGDVYRSPSEGVAENADPGNLV